MIDYDVDIVGQKVATVLEGIDGAMVMEEAAGTSLSIQLLCSTSNFFTRLCRWHNLHVNINRIPVQIFYQVLYVKNTSISSSDISPSSSHKIILAFPVQIFYLVLHIKITSISSYFSLVQ